MFTAKNVAMIGLTGIVLALSVATISDMPQYGFSIGEPDNLTINPNEWTEYGVYLDNTETDANGYLVFEKYSTAPQIGSYEAKTYCNSAQKTIPSHIVINATNIVPTGENRRNVVANIVTKEPEATEAGDVQTTVEDSFYVKNGTEDYDLSDIGGEENVYLRLDFETQASGETPAIKAIDYEYVCLEHIDYGVKDFAQFFLYFMVVVLVAGIGFHNKSNT